MLQYNCYYITKTDMSKLADSYERAVAENAKTRSASYSGFDFNKTWTIDEGISTPKLREISGAGTKAQPYLVRHFSDLYNTEQRYYKLLNNIKADSIISFTGILDGSGHIINADYSYIFNDLSSGAYVGNIIANGNYGLAQTAENATIEHCLHTYGGTRSYPLINTAENCTIRYCGADGVDIYSSQTGGGLVNTLNGGSMENCYFRNGAVTGTNTTGGLVGSNSGGIISDCYVDNVTVNGANNAGGFAGRNEGNSNIKNCRTNAVVTGTSYCGTFVGVNNGMITSATATGTTLDGTSTQFAGADSGTSTTASAAIYKPIQTVEKSVSLDLPDIKIETAAPAVQAKLSDISGHWAEKTITALTDSNVINGYDDGTFRPQNSVTKAEYIKLLLSANKTKLTDGFTAYEDVNKHWARNNINTAILLGICDNIAVSGSNFGADSPISRAQAAALMGRLISQEVSGTPEFADTADIPSWAQAPVYACVQKGLIQGMDDNKFMPNNTLTRAEATTIIERVMNLNK